jgi:uncharacterized membrane protein YkoI
MKRGAVSLISAVALFALPATALADREEGPDRAGTDREQQERKTVQVPPEVHKTIKSEIGNAKIRDIDSTEDNGEVVYEVEYEKAGKTYEMDIAPDGSVLRKDKG